MNLYRKEGIVLALVLLTNFTSLMRTLYNYGSKHLIHTETKWMCYNSRKPHQV